MELSVTGRRTTVPPSFKEHASGKLEHLARFDPQVQRVSLELRIEPNPRQHDTHDCVELAWYTRREVVRTSGCGANAYAAFEQALDRLAARLHRDHDRKRVHHGVRTPESVAAATARLAEPEGEPASA